MLGTLCLTIGLGFPATSPGSAPPPPESELVARIELHRGRALLVNETGVVPVKRHQGPLVSLGPGHLELAPASRAEVHWIGVASLTLSGPTSISWRERKSGELLWRFGDLHQVEAEIRAGEVRVDLPDAWRVELGRGAFFVRGLPGGGVKLEHQAGTALRARWVGGEGSSPPALLLGPGQSVELAGAPRVESSVDVTASTSPWTPTSWPWGRGGIPDVPDLTVDSGRPWPPGDWPWGPDPATIEPWERWDWPWNAGQAVAPRVEAAPGDAPKTGPEGEARSDAEPGAPPEPEPGPILPLEEIEDEPLPPPPVAPPRDPREVAPDDAPPAIEAALDPEPVVEPVEDPAPTAGDGRALLEPEAESAGSPLWRGLPEKRLEAGRNYRLERSEFWLRQKLPSGRTRLELDRRALEPRWYFGPELDLRLFPGAAVVVESDGRLVHHVGWVRILSPVAGRDWSSDS